MSASKVNFPDRLSRVGVRAWALLLAVSALLFAANFLAATWYANQITNASALAFGLQVDAQKLGRFAGEAVNGREEAFAELQATRDAVTTAVAALNDGSAEQGIPAYRGSLMLPQVAASLEEVSLTWERMATDVDQVLAAQNEILSLAQTADAFTGRIPRITARLDEVVRSMSDAGAPASQINIANRQIVLANRMAQRVAEIRAGSDQSDALSRDAALFNQVLVGLSEGNADLGVQAVGTAAARNAVQIVETQFGEAQAELDALLTAAPNLFAVQAASAVLSGESEVLTENSAALAEAFGNVGVTRVFPNNWWAIGSGLGLLLGLFGLLYTIFTEGRRRERSATELNQRNQEAILRLLDEMGSLAEGDLTAKATVTEDITGAIADSINFAIDQLRTLVGTINETAVQVAAAAQETQATAMHLADAAEHQAQQITSASAKINEIAASIDEVSKNSAESADVAQRSVQIAAKGAEVVRQTIQGMDNIRDQIQETSKRIKRLGESSQEIGSIIELINDISEQTNILALNAAIQAASAGEAGRGFAVVADEVQRLAERASNATKRIETLVATIQSDTNEAVSSMEQTTAEVVAGARLAEDAGLALVEIEKVSNDLAGLIDGISQASRQQSAAATNITATMTVIQEITTQTSHGASQTAESIGNLAQLAADLRRSVADFKLPD
ncbi:methyl-accepting chemotaxis protein [Silanimonas sp.]|uniref:methyl-accepting chemotaxis protein n=1 Tax=Silanimonas sp. TaxID=1929290 RepID=UPI001BBBAFF7|nr:methyl-accepting chemotaxis protein [Silanimonas sp.]MBS3895281.1 methyl-accepting chemotaxis protein [Silanimonas sp.]MBS3923735.1 methyl-accepting chemotaxis protein [Xanthomonadaceae bacterium]